MRAFVALNVEATFEPEAELRKLALELAGELNLPPDRLNDAVKGFLPGEPESKNRVMSLSHLSVWTPPASYLLAIKAILARFDSRDADDLRLLIEKLGITKPAQAFEIIEYYYPHQAIPPKTQFFIEEILEKQNRTPRH